MLDVFWKIKLRLTQFYKYNIPMTNRKIMFYSIPMYLASCTVMPEGRSVTLGARPPPGMVFTKTAKVSPEPHQNG